MPQTPENVLEPRRRFRRQAKRTELQIAGIVVAATISGYVIVVIANLVILTLTDSLEARLFLIIIVDLIVFAISLYFLQFAIPPWFEHTQLRRIMRGEDAAADVSPHEFARVSLASVVIPLLLAIPVNFLLQSLRQPIGTALGMLGVLPLIFAFIYHRIPNCRRSVKYAAFFTGGALLSGAFGSGSAKASPFSSLWIFMPPIMAIAVYLLMRKLIQPADAMVPGERSTRRAVSWLRWTMTVGPGPGLGLLVFTVVRLIPIMGDLFWAARIWSKERLSQTPVLFVRSFSHAASSVLLAKTVAPALSRTCVMVALIHPSQTTAALNKRTHEAWTPLTIGVPNDRWQGWFLRQLEGALAVVVDASELTTHLRWELENSIRVLGRDRVVALMPAEATNELQDCLVLSYSPTNPMSAKPELRRWIDHIVRQCLETASDDLASIRGVQAPS